MVQTLPQVETAPLSAPFLSLSVRLVLFSRRLRAPVVLRTRASRDRRIRFPLASPL